VALFNIPTGIGAVLGTAAITKLAPPILAKTIESKGVRAGLPVSVQLKADQLMEELRAHGKAMQLLKRSRQ